jgi:phosphoglycolate phosphatase-like HAD superfamily hydrolase
MSPKITTVVFDMDGVITTEEKYWACARLTVWEVVTQVLGLADALPTPLHAASIRESIIPDSLIYALKGRSVNSNWDITFVVVCVYLAALAGGRASSSDTPDALFAVLRQQNLVAPPWPEALVAFLNSATVDGRDLVEYAGRWAEHALGSRAPGLFDPEGALWWALHRRFQRFYHGEALREYGAPLLEDGTVLPADQIVATLDRLDQMGFTLATATGRPIDELEDALAALHVLRFFGNRLGTLDKVREAERILGVVGLVKPHPYSLLYALHPDRPVSALMDAQFASLPRPQVVMVGDSTSDILMGKAGGCQTVGVMTGVRGVKAKEVRRQILIKVGADVILEDITELPGYLERLNQTA